MDIKEFLQKAEIQELLEEENLAEIYENIDNYNRCNLTKFFLDNNINPLEYMTEVLPYMYIKLKFKNITIPNNIKIIDEAAFWDWESLTNITLPNSITSIGSYAFSGCRNLTSIIIPDNVKSIGDAAFGDCSGLTMVNITDLAAWCNINFDSVFSNPLSYAKKLYINGNLATDITIPTNVISIRNYTFSFCESLTSITIPGSVTSIGDRAFEYCSNLTSINIGNNVASIEKEVFFGCDSLNIIKYIGTKDEWKNIKKSSKWRIGSEIKEIHCSNGIIKLK